MIILYLLNNVQDKVRENKTNLNEKKINFIFEREHMHNFQQNLFEMAVKDSISISTSNLEQCMVSF